MKSHYCLVVLLFVFFCFSATAFIVSNSTYNKITHSEKGDPGLEGLQGLSSTINGTNGSMGQYLIASLISSLSVPINILFDFFQTNVSLLSTNKINANSMKIGDIIQIDINGLFNPRDFYPNFLTLKYGTVNNVEAFLNINMYYVESAFFHVRIYLQLTTSNLVNILVVKVIDTEILTPQPIYIENKPFDSTVDQYLFFGIHDNDTLDLIIKQFSAKKIH